eukprot:527328_1
MVGLQPGLAGWQRTVPGARRWVARRDTQRHHHCVGFMIIALVAGGISTSLLERDVAGLWVDMEVGLGEVRQGTVVRVGVSVDDRPNGDPGGQVPLDLGVLGIDCAPQAGDVGNHVGSLGTGDVVRAEPDVVPSGDVLKKDGGS